MQRLRLLRAGLLCCALVMGWEDGHPGQRYRRRSAERMDHVGGELSPNLGYVLTVNLAELLDGLDVK